ncbi:MAG: flavodoxin [Bacteroidota bacterium]
MKKIGIFYGSTLGNTRRIAEKIQAQFGAENAILHSMENSKAKDILFYDNLIFGTSTWGVGEMQEDWENFAATLKSLDLSDKKIALFGVGDQKEWTDSFVNGMGMLHHHLPAKENVVGFTSPDSYHFEISLAIQNGEFVGLPIDDVNQPELTDKRIESWVEQLKREFH